MEIMNPIVIIVCSVIALIVMFFNLKRKTKYTSGKKVANTKYIKETDYYKNKVKRYIIISNTIKVLSIICIIISSVLVARIVKVQTKSEDRYNRDILIGLDISTSQSQVNLELVKKIKSIIPNIEGDRIGIVIFNTAPVVFCPLTDDYDYINECLDTIERQIEILIENNGYPPIISKDGEESSAAFWYGGAIANSEERGSSLIGDGLAGTLFSFPDLKTNNDRTRIIIFATDNAVDGTEDVSLEDACKLCKKYKINLYAYSPTVQMNTYTNQANIDAYQKAIENDAGGKFYTGDLKKMTSNIVNEIKDTKATLLKTSKKTIITDYPEVVLIVLMVMYTILIFIEKRIKI